LTSTVCTAPRTAPTRRVVSKPTAWRVHEPTDLRTRG